MVRRASVAFLLVFGCCLGACAGGEQPRDELGRGDGLGGRDGPASPTRHLPNVFLSPAGQPFRASFGAPYPVATWFAEADTNHDGRLTRAEFRADAAAFFSQLDTNHDGVITGVEVQAYEQVVAPEIEPRIIDLHDGEGTDQNLDLGDERNTSHPRTDDRHAHRMADAQPGRTPNSIGVQGAATYSLLNEPEPVTAADTAFDGRITLKEFLAAADRRFDRLDAKQLGYLTLASLPRTPIQDAMARARGTKPTTIPLKH